MGGVATSITASLERGTRRQKDPIVTVQANTSIPIPEILRWSDNACMSIGPEYIIMEHVNGVVLEEVWPRMAGGQQIQCIRAMFEQIKAFANIRFPAHGSLYHADALLGAVPTFHWIKTPVSALSVALSFGAAVLSNPDVITIQSLTRARVTLTFPCMSEDPRILEATAPTLLQPDLHKRNVFVSKEDPTVVIGIIDWQWPASSRILQWADLGLPGTTPFAIPGAEDLVIHQQHYRRFVAAQEQTRDLSHLLNAASDGWLPPEGWAATSPAHRRMFANMLEAVSGNKGPDDNEPIRDERDLGKIWS
ncbi:hypothetical protein CLCR_04103 [Cladophialophora carrionii]|uniref:Altered inheritance of mitochondria protein 9, mitochondrial n=1 Tax=Cladophialophora carrionii TaxID=86049 RepID=A0A1C1CIW4_9EURO|nr:hypothetical protein CLCR_04103 [Cladophialophora carrionii]